MVRDRQRKDKASLEEEKTEEEKTKEEKTAGRAPTVSRTFFPYFFTPYFYLYALALVFYIYGSIIVGASRLKVVPHRSELLARGTFFRQC